MQGSLIFVVIVAVWAAYLVQHWVRRREEAAEVRSVDRFSQAMRVLPKRPPLPVSDLGASRPRSYTLTPGRSSLAAGAPQVPRASRAMVEVKRATPVGGARFDAAPYDRSSGPAPATEEQQSPINDPPTRNDLTEVEPMSRTLAPQPPTNAAVSASSSTASSAASGPGRGQRLLRAALLLVALLWVPASVTLALTGTLTWLSVPFALLTVAAVVFWLRTEAAADRAARARRLNGASSLTGTPAPLVNDTQAVATHAYASSSHENAPVEPNEVAASRRRPVAFFDGQATQVTARVTATQDASATEEGTAEGIVASAGDVEPQAAPGTWSPVPVPRPTYAMKAKASPPRMTESGIPADVFATPEFADEADELDERALFARRAVSG